MKKYTLQEASNVSLASLFEEACGDETVAVVDGDRQIVLWPYNPAPDASIAQYSDEEIELQNQFAEESARASLAYLSQELKK